ncbi:MAG: hypothetical protein E7598_02440 [Ruminococcaceae bacterium]|nr:hypothetical protein [Oscillospiraceae bacterium]
MKKYCYLILTVFVIAFSLCTSAAESDDGLWVYEPYGDGVVLTEYKGSATDVYVPSNIKADGENLDVVKLGDSIFENNDALNSVTLGAGVTEIGAKAFYDADNMVCILLAEDTTTIGAEAFYACDSFNSIILYDAVTAIGENAFGECAKLTVWCNLNSSGYNYAVANTIKYELLTVDAEPVIITEGGLTYYIQNGEAIAVDCDDTLTEVVVPSTVQGYPVVELRETFRGHKNLQKIKLNEGLRIISSNAFISCLNLKSITLPITVTYIGDNAFSKCAVLEKAILTDSVTYVGEYAFNECELLSEIVFSNSILEIKPYTFYKCISLKSINISNQLTIIGRYSFYGTGLTSIKLPETLTLLGQLSFYDCDYITEIIVPGSVTEIGQGPFWNCSELVYAELGDGIKTLGLQMFLGCVKLETVVLPDTLTEIKREAFYNCKSLKNITIPQSVNVIRTEAFYGCSDLTYLIIPQNTKTIEKTAFYTNTVLGVYEGSRAHTVAINNDYLFYTIIDDSFPEFYYSNGVQYYIAENQAYAIHFDGSQTHVVIPDEINGLPVVSIKETFRDKDNLVSIAFNSNITNIDPYAFAYCDSLSKVVLHNKIEKIGAYAFVSCKALTEFEMPDSIVEVEERAFSYCEELIDVTISKNLTKISSAMFLECRNLPKLELHEGITSIGSMAFFNCVKLSDFALPQSVRMINYGAFEGCRFEKIDIPEGVTEINDWTFSACNLKEISFPSTLQKIGNYAFNICGLTKIDLPDSLLVLGDNAFYWCNNLTEVIIPPNVTTLGSQVFGRCYAIRTAVIPRSVSSMKKDTFPSNTLLLVEEGSYAHEFSLDNDLLFVVWDGETEFSLVEKDGIEYVVFEDFACAVAYNGTNKNIIIPDKVNDVPVTMLQGTFRNNKNIRTVDLPNTIKTIGAATFSDCTSLYSVNIKEGVTTIKNSAFYWCTNLRTATLPESVTTIGAGAFNGCKSLENFEIPSNVNYIGARAFVYCYKFTDVVIPKGVTEIYDETFYYCTSLSSITIPQSVKRIGDSAFYSCTNLEEVKMNDGIEIIGSSAFVNCEKLQSISLPSSVIAIKENAFLGCNSMKRIIVPQSVMELSLHSFPNMVMLVDENSYAHNFAVENDLLYFVLHKTENPEIDYGAGITGTVTYTDGSMASDATVEILYDDGTLKETVTTDANGVYSFTYAEVGRYIVRATDASGNTSTTTVSVKRMNVFDVFVSGDTDLTLKQGWSVSGTVSEDIATVTISDENGNVIDTVETTDGTFMFGNIPNGTYVVTAANENGTVSQEITVYNANVSGIALVIPTEDTAATVWGYVEVEDRDKNHHRRIWINVTIYNDEGVVVGQAKSDADGKYVFAGLPIGEYTIVAETEEMRPDKQHKFDRSHKLTGYAYINVTEADEYQVDTIVLYEENEYTAKVSGKVTAEGETQDCEVILRDVFRNEVAKQITGKNGKYSFVNVRDGLYFIFAVTKSDGMGMAVIVVRDGEVYGETDIRVSKKDFIRERDDKFREEINCNNRDEALLHRERIAEEKRFYDSLSDKEKKQLSKDYIERLERYSAWLAEVDYTAPEGVKVEQGGLVVSGDEIENEETVSFNITVEKQEEYVESTDGIKNEKDYKKQKIKDNAGNKEIKEYYEITMTKTTDDGEKSITSVRKDTDANGKFRVTLDIPEEYRGYKNYTILHEHYGEVVTLVDLDDNPDTITFEVDKFSTFVLAASNEDTIEDVSEDEPVEGDVDGNGVLNITDVLKLLGSIVNETELDGADLNGDGKVTLLDVIKVLKKVVA